MAGWRNANGEPREIWTARTPGLEWKSKVGLEHQSWPVPFAFKFSFICLNPQIAGAAPTSAFVRQLRDPPMTHSLGDVGEDSTTYSSGKRILKKSYSEVFPNKTRPI
jgi:hypothetical protein